MLRLAGWCHKRNRFRDSHSCWIGTLKDQKYVSEDLANETLGLTASAPSTVAQLHSPKPTEKTRLSRLRASNQLRNAFIYGFAAYCRSVTDFAVAWQELLHCRRMPQVRSSRMADLGHEVTGLAVQRLGASDASSRISFKEIAPGRWLQGRASKIQTSAQFILSPSPAIPAHRILADTAL